MHFARSLLVLMGLVGAAAQVTVPTAAKFCGTSKGKRCPNKVTLGSGNNTVISVGGTPILDLTKTSATVKVAGLVKFESQSLEAKITGDVKLDTDGKTTIESGAVDLSSSGKIRVLGGAGVYYPAADAAAGVIKEGFPETQFCPGAAVIKDPRDPNPASLATVTTNLLGTMAIKKFGDTGEALTHICIDYPFSTTTGAPLNFPLQETPALIAVWVPLRTSPPAKPWLKLDGSVA